MDFKMPGMGGYEATRQIRAMNPDIPIIAQTAYALSGDRQKAIDAGCNAYISKPIRQRCAYADYSTVFIDFFEKYLKVFSEVFLK